MNKISNNSKTINYRIYLKLDKLIGGLDNFLNEDETGYMKITVPGFMVLNINRLDKLRISIAHNYIQNGDMMADPDMEVMIDVDHKVASALTYQQDCFGKFEAAYNVEGSEQILLVAQMNNFLDLWLGNLKHQGFFDENVRTVTRY